MYYGLWGKHPVVTPIAKQKQNNFLTFAYLIDAALEEITFTIKANWFCFYFQTCYLSSINCKVIVCDIAK